MDILDHIGITGLIRIITVPDLGLESTLPSGDGHLDWSSLISQPIKRRVTRLVLMEILFQIPVPHSWFYMVLYIDPQRRLYEGQSTTPPRMKAKTRIIYTLCRRIGDIIIHIRRKEDDTGIKSEST